MGRMRWVSISSSLLLALSVAAVCEPLELPKVFNICTEVTPGTITVCRATTLSGRQFLPTPAGGDVIDIKRFDRTGITLHISPKDSHGEVVMDLTGTIVGTSAKGTVIESMPEHPGIKIPGKWNATFFYPPKGRSGHGKNLYVACPDEISIVNTSDHSVRPVKLPAEDKFGAMAVSTDGTKAYINTAADALHPARLLVVDGTEGVVSRSLSLAKTTMPGGFWGFVVSADGSTLYGIGYNKANNELEVGTVDVPSGELKIIAPILGKNLMDGLILSGTKLYLSDGAPLDIKMPASQISAFSSNSHGVVASADGEHFCALNRDSANYRDSPRAVGGCMAISPDGKRLFLGEQVVIVQDAPPGSLKGAGVLPSGSGGMVLTPDGATLYVAETDTSMVYAYDTATNLLYDVVNVCKNPRTLGIQPMTRASK